MALIVIDRPEDARPQTVESWGLVCEPTRFEGKAINRQLRGRQPTTDTQTTAPQTTDPQTTDHRHTDNRPTDNRPPTNRQPTHNCEIDRYAIDGLATTALKDFSSKSGNSGSCGRGRPPWAGPHRCTKGSESDRVEHEEEPSAPRLLSGGTSSHSGFWSLTPSPHLRLN
ncbi:unnamed protein product [Pleuronectes platessa]|uniref:Uncharacterized protein n=1 Tax=Pleuronectes platessa TaxID=8262 RepID=A0A9N7UFR2_PLEPL|nr:unnamed protein product [Pleuronectes platessa]